MSDLIFQPDHEPTEQEVDHIRSAFRFAQGHAPVVLPKGWTVRPFPLEPVEHLSEPVASSPFPWLDTVVAVGLTLLLCTALICVTLILVLGVR